MTPKILLVGSGAIGTIYVYYLLKSGCSVTAVCRSNYSAAKTQGFHIDSIHFGQNVHITPTYVVRTPSEAVEQGPFDYIIVTSKVLPEARLAQQIAPAVTTGHTTIVLIQNGISIEDEYVAQFPQNPILSCVVYMLVTQTAPGHILMSGPDRLEVGTFPASDLHPSAQKNAETLVSLLTSAGATATLHADIQEKRWSKLLMNAPWNPICALTLCRDVPFLASSDVAERVIKGVMSEVCTIYAALGYDSVNEEAATRSFEVMRSRIGTKGIEPSMLGDVLWSRRMEVEVILGNPVRVAQKLGLDVPRMEMLYALIKALDKAMQYRKPGKSLDTEDLNPEN